MTAEGSSMIGLHLYSADHSPIAEGSYSCNPETIVTFIVNVFWQTQGNPK
jgi:hypothetical protein